MAERLGTSVNFLSYMERGLKAPSFDNLERMVKVFRIPVAR
jgi:transcriptional regulator with XRE-family HTH domain